MIFPAELQSSTPSKYLFKLETDIDSVICDPEPIEWASGEIEFKRDLDAGGVFTSFHLESLTFVGNGADFLKKLFTASEVNAKCTLIIYWWKEFDLVTPANGRQYIEFPSRFDINFCFYEVVKVGKFSFGVKIKAVNSSTQTKLDNRQEVDVNLSNLTTIGGVSIQDYPALKKGLFYPAMNFNYKAQLFINTVKTAFTGNLTFAMLNALGVGYNLPHVKHKITYTSIPLNLTTNDFPAQVYSVKYVTQATLDYIPPLFSNALYDYDLTFDYYIKVIVTNRYVGSFPWNIQLLETEVVNFVRIIRNTYDLFGFGGETQIYEKGDSLEITVHKNCSLVLVVQSPGIDATYYAKLISATIALTQQVVTSKDRLTEGYPVYEAIERNCQHMLDTQYPFYSDFFGRTDNQYSKTGKKYLTENQLRFAHIQTGSNQRGFSLSNVNSPLVVNFKDLFQTLKAVYNVGYSLEINPTLFGDNLQRVRIEQYAFFFSDEELVFDPPLSERISQYDIQSAIMPELIPVNIKAGFDSYEYLSINGRSEPNTTNQRTTVMNTANKLEIIAKFRGDTKGIVNNLSIDANTEDTKGETDIYIVKTQKGSGLTVPQDWVVEKGENITIENNTSLFGDDLMNRYFTPTRILKRFGNRIKSGMTKFIGSLLLFQKSDKDSSLETTGEGYFIKESDSILVADLEDPIYKPIKHSIECRFTFADLELLQSNTTKYLKFSENLSGYLLSLKKKNNEDKAEITIIERYVN